jgi:hypothetical protein
MFLVTKEQWQQFISEMETESYEIMRQSLIPFYLERKNFEHLRNLHGPDWKKYVIGEEPPNWIFVYQDKEFAYFIPEKLSENFRLKAKEVLELDGISEKDEKYEQKLDYEFFKLCYEFNNFNKDKIYKIAK